MTVQDALSSTIMFFSSIMIYSLCAGVQRRAPRTLSALTSSISTSSTKNDSGKSPKKSPIYTRTGDAGTSSLYNGERRPKADMIFHALGNQDELNAAIGIAYEHCTLSKNNLAIMLVEIQSRIFDLGAAVATPLTNSSDAKIAYTTFPDTHTRQLEVWIDELDASLPPLTAFILPSGGLSAAHLHLSRTICRRAERSVVPLVQEGLVDGEVGRYLNRLSDFLFVAARAAAQRENRQETTWQKSKTV